MTYFCVAVLLFFTIYFYPPMDALQQTRLSIVLFTPAVSHETVNPPTIKNTIRGGVDDSNKTFQSFYLSFRVKQFWWQSGRRRHEIFAKTNFRQLLIIVFQVLLR